MIASMPNGRSRVGTALRGERSEAAGESSLDFSPKSVSFGLKSKLLCSVMLGLMAAPLSAQNILMKDGRTIIAKSLRRQGDLIMATVEITPATTGDKPAPAQTGEVGYALAQINRLDFPEPAQMRTVPELILAGRMPEALAQIEPVVKYYES